MESHKIANLLTPIIFSKDLQKETGTLLMIKIMDNMV